MFVSPWMAIKLETGDRGVGLGKTGPLLQVGQLRRSGFHSRVPWEPGGSCPQGALVKFASALAFSLPCLLLLPFTGPPPPNREHFHNTVPSHEALSPGVLPRNLMEDIPFIPQAFIEHLLYIRHQGRS